MINYCFLILFHHSDTTVLNLLKFMVRSSSQAAAQQQRGEDNAEGLSDASFLCFPPARSWSHTSTYSEKVEEGVRGPSLAPSCSQSAFHFQTTD